MIFVSAFYVATWLPDHVYYLFINFNGYLPVPDVVFHVVILLAFIYICTNPFIYATKFTPIRRVLVDLMPRKKSQQAADSTTAQTKQAAVC